MYRILYLNQATNISYETHYQGLINAHCLARLCHDVLYITDQPDDINSFLEGPTYTIDELFNDAIDKKESVYQPSLDHHIIDIIRNPDSLRDIIETFGKKLDFIIYNGSANWAIMARQIGDNYNAISININAYKLTPAVNEIQLKHVLHNERIAQNRIITDSEFIFEMDIENMRNIVDKFGIPAYIIGHYTGKDPLEQFNFRSPDQPGSNIQLMHHTTYKGRMTAIYQSRIYIQLPFNNRIQGAIDSLALGIPVADLSGSDILTEYKAIDNMDNIAYVINQNYLVEPNNSFSFANRMVRLQGILEMVNKQWNRD